MRKILKLNDYIPFEGSKCDTVSQTDSSGYMSTTSLILGMLESGSSLASHRKAVYDSYLEGDKQVIDEDSAVLSSFVHQYDFDLIKAQDVKNYLDTKSKKSKLTKEEESISSATESVIDSSIPQPEEQSS